MTRKWPQGPVGRPPRPAGLLGRVLRPLLRGPLCCVATAMLAAVAAHPARGAELSEPAPAREAPAAAAGKATAAEAQAVVAEAERRLLGPSIEVQRAHWLPANLITFHTETLPAPA